MSGGARLVVALACAGALLACAGAGSERVAMRRPEMFDAHLLVEGARVFDERCAACHGDKGHGDGMLADVLPIRPRNYHSEPFKWGSTPDAIVHTIRWGRSGVMPAFEEALTPQEMWAAAYLVWHWVPPERRESANGGEAP